MASNLMQRDPFGSLARFDPFTEVDDIFRDFFALPALRTRAATPRIRLDISENDKAYRVNAEIPGVNRDDIQVSIEGNRVSINAEIKEEKQSVEAGKVVRNERVYGQQYRSFILPQEVDDATAEAKYHDGILELTLPKKVGTGGKQLSIQ